MARGSIPFTFCTGLLAFMHCISSCFLCVTYLFIFIDLGRINSNPAIVFDVYKTLTLNKIILSM